MISDDEGYQTHIQFTYLCTGWILPFRCALVTAIAVVVMKIQYITTHTLINGKKTKPSSFFGVHIFNNPTKIRKTKSTGLHVKLKGFPQ